MVLQIPETTRYLALNRQEQLISRVESNRLEAGGPHLTEPRELGAPIFGAVLSQLIGVPAGFAGGVSLGGVFFAAAKIPAG